MTLNYQDIENAVNQEENAGGFALLIQRFKNLGVKRYDYFVEEGVYRYYDENSTIDLRMNGVAKTVAEQPSASGIKAAVTKAQAGMIDFEGFCQLAGKAGISYWITDLEQMVVSYRDVKKNEILAEPIPLITEQ
ncbi:DUF1398 family protein [Enterococcus sp. LJL51]|uniref:DUF1398 family protein n=1 Tax=Enterococcus sp. LJL51 TaxID=3416656 RepID=UPI003CE8ABAC